MMKQLHGMSIVLIISIFVSSLRLISQDHAPMFTTIDSIMHANYPSDNPGASIIVVKDHKTIFHSAYGLANVEKQIPNKSNTIFRIGSITKQFTAICILKLIEEDKLALSDKLSKFYPELFSQHKPITIQQLLTHTSGIKDLPRIDAIRPLLSVHTEPYELIKIISHEGLNFLPGEKYEYSNSGYVILGGILEQITQLSYADILQKNIFAPLGMKNSFFANKKDLSENIAEGYFTRPDHYASAPDINSSLLFAAGGIWSTTEDMAIWNEALYDDKLIDSKSIELAFTPGKLNNGTQTDYGFAFRTCQVNGQKSIEHGGGVFGYNSYGIRIEPYGIYVLILSNFERENEYDDLAAIIAAETMNKPYRPANNEYNMTLQKAEPYIGKYVTEKKDSLQVFFENNKLMMRKGNKKDFLLIPIETNLYQISDSLDDRVEFNIGAQASLIWKPRRAMAVYAIRITDD